MILTQRIGDDYTHKICLNWNNHSFDPDGYNLIFTVKSSFSDLDENAKIQKALGFGISVMGSKALVEILHRDTAGDEFNDPVIPALTQGRYVWDIQATLIVGILVSEIKTVASGTLDLIPDVTRRLEPTVPIYTHSPSLISSLLDIDGGDPSSDFIPEDEIDGGTP